MVKLERKSRLPKIYRAKHLLPKENLCMDYILLPYGFAYNKEWESAKHGDIIRFFDGSDRRIFSVRKVKISSPTVDILCRCRYGLTIKAALMRWKRNVTLEGHQGSVISNEACYLVAFEKLESNEDTD